MKIEWINKKVKLSDVKEYEANPRTITEKGLSILKESYKKFGQMHPLVVNTDMTLIGGHAGKLVMQSLDYEYCDIFIPNRKLTDKEVQEANIRLNKNIAGEFNFDILTEFFETGDLLEWGFETQELELDIDGNYQKHVIEEELYNTPEQLHPNQEYILIICEKDEYDEARENLGLGYCTKNNGAKDKVVKSRTIKYRDYVNSNTK